LDGFRSLAKINNEQSLREQEQGRHEFLPDICTPQAVFFLVLLGELLALVLAVADAERVSFAWGGFDWAGLGLRSIFIQWVTLLSAVILCRMRPWLAGKPARQAGLVSYAVVQVVTLTCTLLAMMAIYRSFEGWLLFSNALLSAIITGIILRYLYLQQQLSNQQQAELQARIQSLQSRIQPHFLFNSMNSVASLIAIDAEKAERLVEDLSALFRANLAEPGLVPISVELELCRQYIEIEQARLDERLQVNWSVDEALIERGSGWQIPSLLLQPLIENAILHGIQPLPEGGVIDVSLAVKEGGVDIRVVNPLPKSGGQQRGEQKTDESRGNRLALKNIEHRLHAHYGTESFISARNIGAQFVTKVYYPGPAKDFKGGI
jgi:two-component system sensor histidine kinase AlgZ